MPKQLYNRSDSPLCMYRQSPSECTKERGKEESKLQICEDCPRWSMDAIYEDIMGRRVEQTYAWWRAEWIEHGEPYARARMADFAGEKEELVLEDPEPRVLDLADFKDELLQIVENASKKDKVDFALEVLRNVVFLAVVVFYLYLVLGGLI